MLKIPTVVVVALALLATPALAQAKRPQGDPASKGPPPRPAIDEKAYKAALERIPEPKEKFDPWGQMRPAAAAKK